MSLDDKIHDAIYAATRKHNQSDTVANRLINWLEQLSDGRANLNNKDDVSNHIDVILQALNIEDNDNEDEMEQMSLEIWE